MFDGSYRTHQRVVNLGSSTTSGRKRNKTAQDRTSILEKTRLLREQRYIEQKQTKACIVIQRRLRGNFVRSHVAEQWKYQITELIASYVNGENSDCSSSEFIKGSENITFLFNAWLRLHLQPLRRMGLSSYEISNKHVQELLYHYSSFIQKLPIKLLSTEDSTSLSSVPEPTENIRPYSLLIIQTALAYIRHCHHQFPNSPSIEDSGSINGIRTLSDTNLIHILSYLLQVPPFDHLDVAAPKDSFDISCTKYLDKSICEHTILFLIEAYCIVFDRSDVSSAKTAMQSNPSQSLLLYLYHCISVMFSVLDDTICYRALRGVVSLIEPSTSTGSRRKQPLHRNSVLQQFLPEVLHVVRPNRRTFNESIPSYNSTFKKYIPNDTTVVVQNVIGHFGIRTLQRYIVDDIVPLLDDLHCSQISPNNESNASTSRQLFDLAMWIQYMKYVLMDTVLDKTFANQKYQENDSEVNLRLLWMTQCMIRGDSNIFSPRNSLPTTSNVDDGDDDGFVDDNDIVMRQLSSTPIQSSQPLTRINDAVASSLNVTAASSTNTNRLSKLDIQTVPKLDRLFVEVIRKLDVTLVTKYSSSSHRHDNETYRSTEVYLMSLARQLADPSFLEKCGIVLLSPIDDDGDDFILRDNDMEFFTMLRYGQDDFLYLCSVFLQATTGLRLQQNAATSSALNSLAFSSLFLQGLWKYVLRQRSITDFLRSHISINDVFLAPQSFLSFQAANDGLCYSMVLFADLFAHHLIVMKDETFLSNYTTARLPSVKPTIFVEDVIQLYKSVLYELYWTKPVRKTDTRLILGTSGDVLRNCSLSQFIAESDDTVFASFRVRLLLTGTKLYNSIYERWCRLYTLTRFCNESVWLFPNLSPSFSFIDDTFVSSNDTFITSEIRQRRGTRSEFEVDDPMDIDDDVSSSDEADNSRSIINGEGDRLAEMFLDPKMARVLSSIPQALPFDQRVKIFDSLLRADKAQSQNDALELRQFMDSMMRLQETGEIPGRETVHVRRNEIYNDSMDQLNKLGRKLKRRLQVTFTNQHGTQEAGIDGGGVFKEFIDDLIKEAFSSTRKHCLFLATPFETLMVNTSVLNQEDVLLHYEFLGRVLGKAVYESILVEPQFCFPFLNQLLGKSNSIEDLKNLDMEYYKNLTKLFDLSSEEIHDMDLSFEMTVKDGSSISSIELLPDGRNVSVTKANLIQYVHLVSHHKLNVMTAHQVKAFLLGFRDLIPASWVQLFSAYELQKVISGDDSVLGIDVSALKQSMQYGAGYHPDQQIIRYFWEIIEEMTPIQQRKFLKFMTSCSRQPLLGFGHLEPAPCIQQIRLPDSLFEAGKKEEIAKKLPLPTSSTCMNLLKLPNYREKYFMKMKIHAAIESGSGFELT